MKYLIDRNAMTDPEKEECRSIEIYIGDSKFTLQESHGDLIVNKYCNIGSSGININPNVSNEIRLS